MRTVNITCENTHQEYEIELGTTLRDVKKIIFPENHNHILGALVNNQLQDLQFVVMTPSAGQLHRCHDPGRIQHLFAFVDFRTISSCSPIISEENTSGRIFYFERHFLPDRQQRNRTDSGNHFRTGK